MSLRDKLARQLPRLGLPSARGLGPRGTPVDIDSQGFLEEAESCPWDPPHNPDPEEKGFGACSDVSDRAARIAGLRRMIGLVTERQAAKARARAEAGAAPLGVGTGASTPHRALRRSIEHLPPDYAHGQVEVARALRVDARSVAGLALDPELAHVDLAKALFLDTETTGLGSGTGIVPFLVGVAWFEDGALVIEQLLLEELGEEGAMLERVHQLVERASCLVTYNGKSYDRPLLDARSVMNRRPPLPVRPHLDLLHCSRRVYKPRLGQVRLADMEAEVLGMNRPRDVDGAEIPGLYWSYLREDRADILGPVIEHNAHDVAALAAILAVLAERYAELHLEDDPRDQLARAKLGLRSGNLARAEAFAVAAAEGGGRPAVTAEAHELLGQVRLKRGDISGALRAFEGGLLGAGGHPTLTASLHLRLAKLLEHRLKRFGEALHHARQTGPAEGVEGSRRRVSRLEGKRTRQVLGLLEHS